MNLSSAFAYGSGTNNGITSLTTAYGTTTFSLTDNNMATNDAIDRAVLVVDPLSGTNLYASLYQASFLTGTSYTVPGIPTGALTNSYTNMTNLNSWHWGPMQFPQLSTNNMYSFTPTDYLKGRQRNWLAGSGSGPGSLVFSDALKMEQAVSPDGSTTGQQVWRAYDGETNGVQGTNAQPAVTAWNLTDSNSAYQLIQRNVWGNPTNAQETWSQTFGGASLSRTNKYSYAANGIDLVQQIGPLGETNGFSYDTNHNVLTTTNAVGDVTTNTYDGQSRLTTVNAPAGLTTSNIYFSSGAYTNWIEQRIDLQIHRTNFYFYSNDLVVIQTNELGLVVSNTWDNLQRLTSTTFPDATHISNIYVNLDRVETLDRLGNQTQYEYDALRHLIAVTNALMNATLFNYCSCGALESVRDALGNVTTNTYDIAGRRVNIAYPDGTSITYNYNLLSQVTNTTDGAGIKMTNWYMDQGLLYASSNVVGQMFLKSFDIEDRLTNSVDGNGVATAMTYDNLRRTLTRSYPDTGMERYGYSAFGLIAYTNQLTNITYYTYDAARRKIAETNALSNTTQYAYDPAGDITNLTDQKTNITQWGYDVYGRVTNKAEAGSTNILAYQYDADDRLTNRWSLARSNTAYKYDAVGNLTNVSYPTNHPLSFAYDSLNWMISMSDGIGTTTFTYTPVGQLASESGPWASDTVTYTYSDRLRTVLDVQQPNSSDWIQTYAYDTANRMKAITSPAGTFTYTYNPGVDGTTSASSLIANLALPNGAFITNTYDNNARLLGTWLDNSGGTNLDSSVYTYNVGNQRTNLTRAGETTVAFTNTATYTYDAIGQVVGDVAAEGTTNRMNEQLH